VQRDGGWCTRPAEGDDWSAERGGNRDQRAGKEKHYACMYSDGERLEFPAAVQVPSTLTLHPLPICALIAGTVHVVPDHKHRKST
jgi:hypothetical protein